MSTAFLVRQSNQLCRRYQNDDLHATDLVTAKSPQRRLRVRYCLTGHLAAMSAAPGEAAEIAVKRTYAALTAGLRVTAAVPAPGRDRDL
jgi:hypothetical protein